MVFTRYLVLADHLHNWPHYDLGFGAPSIDALHHRRRLCRSCQLTAIMIINGIVIIWIKSTSLKDSTIVIVLLALLHHHFCISFSFVLRRLHPLIGCCPRKPLTLPPMHTASAQSRNFVYVEPTNWNCLSWELTSFICSFHCFSGACSLYYSTIISLI